MPNKPTSKQISLGNNGNTLNTVVYANGVVNATEIQVGGIPVINSDGYFVGTGGGGSGAQGATGAQGADGYVGSDGAQGAIGAQGIQGLSGIGIQGTAGAQGIQGLTGAADQDTIDGKRNRHGFPYDPDLGYEVTLSYSRANKQVTITPIGSSFNVWIHGVRNEFNTPLVSDAHANTTSISME
jgi:hypothetical protein